jgi:hypothetical protein
MTKYRIYAIKKDDLGYEYERKWLTILLSIYFTNPQSYHYQ